MPPLKKTKIVCTIGPATESQESLEKLLKAGMNVMRLNFSHGDFNEHQGRVENFRKAAAKVGVPATILQDLGGPKIRIGNFSTDMVTLKPGKSFTLTTDDIVGDESRVSINYPLLPKETKVGDTIFLHDGRKKLQVTAVKGNDVVTKVIVGGDIRGKRGVNLPDAELSISSLTEKDRKDLEFGIKNKVDYFALSFVRRPSDITELRDILNKKKFKAGIIAKIETPQAVQNIDAILELVDGIMVARGDLAIEVPAEQVPMIQKSIIRKCNDLGKPVITATQMLESMIKAPVPTRAEVSDIANAILDGTDAIMLSEETAMGEFPVEAVGMMSKVAAEVEIQYPSRYAINTGKKGAMDYVDSLTGHVVNTTHDIGAKAIFALSETGFTARMISRFKPDAVIIAATPNERTYNCLALIGGCHPLMVPREEELSAVMSTIRKECTRLKIAKKGDRVVVAAGAPFNDSKVVTNMMLVEEI